MAGASRASDHRGAELRPREPAQRPRSRTAKDRRAPRPPAASSWLSGVSARSMGIENLELFSGVSP